MSIRPFHVQIPDPVLIDLRERILRTRWPDEIAGSRWEHGAHLAYVKELAEYWSRTFDWRAVEQRVNAFPNFLGEVDGYQVHFLRIKGKRKDSFPLIITHGWPGSFLEIMKLIPLLTEDDGFSFDIVVPSMLGFGFSQKVTEPGCNVHLMGRVWHRLMSELGYNRYGTQGGDFGAGVSTALGLKYPEHVAGVHLNYIPGSYAPYVPPGETLTEEELQFERSADEWYDREGAYAHQQRTKPLTLAYGLNDSPVGLCAWILEKFYGWADIGQGLEQVFTKDELLANVTLYWVTETLHSSVRLYNENSKVPFRFRKGEYVKVPVGVARFPLEEPFPPRRYIERGYNIQRWADMPKGGHFAALEQPALLANDIREFFRSL